MDWTVILLTFVVGIGIGMAVMELLRVAVGEEIDIGPDDVVEIVVNGRVVHRRDGKGKR